MQLKQYQQRTLQRFREYLKALDVARAKSALAAALNIDYEWDKQAWKDAGIATAYTPHKNGLHEPLPFVCFKIPTAGGKTLLAVHAIGALNDLYRHSQTGLVLWIVPTSQIYNQTYRALRDKQHPYRQQLDMASGGRTLILEKDQLFAPEDVNSQLVIMMLMLPSANRQVKETLKIFQDRGGFESFFPEEDQYQQHDALRERVKNLDAYRAGDAYGGVVKSSLGNTLRLLKPIIVLDEGHKAYSAQAQDTLRGFNPSFILELTATPPPESNRLVNISGQELLREGMIKLPINVHSRATVDWHDALIASYHKRAQLEQIAEDYFTREGIYIRPICLIQVERTGEKQRLPGLIHAEDVRDYLITRLNVLPEEIAVKSSERDEIENIDLLSPDCPIRFIITKHALQEGWDCAFAYILTTLVNSKAPASMTQLVGRILRQPYARKTNVAALDESYVYYSSPQTGELINRVYASLRDEGLDDVQGGTHIHRDLEDDPAQKIELPLRPQFQAYAGKVYLPCFVVEDDGEFREVGYEMDILSRIRWEKINLARFDSLELNPTPVGHADVAIGLEGMESPIRVVDAVDLKLEPAFITRQILDVVPNPWVAYEIVQNVIVRLRRRYSDDEIRRDLGFVITQLKETLAQGRDAQAREIFLELLSSEQLHFWLIAGSAGNAIPERIRARSGAKLRYPDTDDVPQRSLFEYNADEFNQPEAAVALYLDQQAWIVWWMRNLVPGGYGIQGWQPHRVYADFLAYQASLQLPTVHVLEIKGLHLKNENTDYKKELFELCNKYSHPVPWNEIAQEFAQHQIKFQVVFDNEWRNVINAMISDQRS